MKTYLLKNPATVERKPEHKPCSGPPTPMPPPTSLTDVSSQDSQPRCSPAHRDAPATGAALPATIPGSAPAVAHGPVLFIGMDVHNESIAVSLAPSDSTEVRRYGMIGGTHDDVLKLAKKLQAAHPDVALRFCYEAGPRGYPLGRFLQGHGHTCILVAPSKIPRKRGDRVKTDRRDADQLARL